MASGRRREDVRFIATSPILYLAAAPLFFALAVWWFHPTLIIEDDSVSYLTGSPARTATYPLFLKLFHGRGLLAAQLALLAASIAWFAVYASRYLPWIASVGLTVVILANPYIWQLQASVLSEALTTPLLVAIVGCIIGFVHTKRPLPILAATFLCGVATTIRPSLLLFIAAPICAVLIGSKVSKRWTVLLIMFGLWVSPLIAERAYSRAVHGDTLTSYVGRNLFMKGALIDAPLTELRSNDPVDRRLLDAVNHDYQAPRQLISRVKDRQVRYILMTNYEACAGYQCGDSFLSGFHLSEADLERHMFRVGAARLASNPLAYLALTLSEYQQLWLLHPRKHPDLAARYNAFLKRESPLPFQSLLSHEGERTPASEQKAIYRLNRAVFVMIGLLAAMMTLGFALRRPGLRIEAAFILLLGTQAVLIFGSFLGVGQPRYVMGLWPALMAGEVMGLISLFELRRPIVIGGESQSSPRQERE